MGSRPRSLSAAKPNPGRSTGSTARARLARSSLGSSWGTSPRGPAASQYRSIPVARSPSAARGRPVTAGEQQVEVPGGVLARPRRPELDVTVPAAGLGADADVADGHALQRGRVVDEDDVSQALAQHRLDLAGDVEARVDRVGEL